MSNSAVIAEEGTERLNRLFGEAVNRYDVPGVVAAVAGKDRVLYRGAFGRRDVRHNIPMHYDTLFRIASMTKPVTSAAVMMFIEEGRIALEDPISRYIPSLQDPGIITAFQEEDATYRRMPARKAITIRHLLTHTSGYGYGFSSQILYQILQKTAKMPRHLPLLHEPGSDWTYGMGTRILGELVELLSGQPLDAFFQERIFTPLGMEDTFYALPEDKKNRLTTYHQRVEGKLLELPNPDEYQSIVSGAGGLISTAPDYLRFLQMLLGGGSRGEVRLLEEESIRLMFRNHIGDLTVKLQTCEDPNSARPFPMGAGRDKFGLGFQITAGKREGLPLRSPGSGTWAGFFNTHFWVDPSQGIAAVIFMQVLPFYDEACMKLYRDFEKILYTHLR